MKSARNKWILLGILTAVLIYIWWDAFHTMYPESTGFQVRQPGQTTARSPQESKDLVYQPPQVNPFRRPEVKAKEKNPAAQAQRQPQPRAELDPQYRLIGVLREGKNSQAVISGAGGASTVLSVGDSLIVWKLAEIYDQYVVFEHDKQKDTIWLYVDSE